MLDPELMSLIARLLGPQGQQSPQMMQLAALIGAPAVAPGYDSRAASPFSPLFGDVNNGPAGINRRGQFMPGLPQSPGMFRAPPAFSDPGIMPPQMSPNFRNL